MLARCLDSTARFGMVGQDQQQRVLSFGTECEIIDWTESDEEDSVTIEVVGRRRFTLVGEPWDEDGCQVSRVDWSAELSADDAH